MMNLISCTDDSLVMLVGSYASTHEEGIKLYSFNQHSGEVSYMNGISGVSNPSYLTISKDKKRVYAVSENDTNDSAVQALSLELPKGKLSLLNAKLTQGAAPCYIALSPREDFVVTANYNGGSISIFPLNENGELQEPQVISFEGHGPDAERQEKSHLHCTVFSPDEKHMLASDLGADCLHLFTVNEQDKKESTSLLDEASQQDLMMPVGSGPRHIVFAPNKKFVYVVTELSGDVIVMEYEEANSKIIQTIKADTLGARGSADIHLTPDGRYLYASNRLQGDGIAIFKVDALTGKLTKVGYQPTGNHPRNFVISPNGKFLLVACRFSNEIEVYLIDKATGLLKDTGKRIKTSEPTCLKFVDGNI